MKFLIIGLGNPGFEYKNTRHNIGFRVLDHLIKCQDVLFTKNKLADTSKFKFKGRNLVLIKPKTYMNLSGKAVNYWLQKTKVRKENILVISDDISLPFGTLRLRPKGSHGGHNGLRDINSALGHKEYARLRFGVGNDFLKGMQADYVLSNFSSQQNENIHEKIDLAVSIIYSFVTNGISKTMSEFNGK